MYVTFLYELDRRTWPKKWHRDFSDYLTRFEATLKSLRGKQVISYGNDDRVKAIAERYSNYTTKPISEWNSWKDLELTRVAIQKKYKEDVPENFSAEYVCLQLCKFDAVLESGAQIWIDGGLRESMTPSTWDRELDSLIQIRHFLPPTNGDFFSGPQHTFVVGTCFASSDLTWLCKKMAETSKQLLSEGKCGYDQQILSYLYTKYPQKFSARKAYYPNGLLRTIKSDWKFSCEPILEPLPGPIFTPQFTCILLISLLHLFLFFRVFGSRQLADL